MDEQFGRFSMLGLAAHHKIHFSQQPFIASCFPRVAGALENTVQISSACDYFDSKCVVL